MFLEIRKMPTEHHKRRFARIRRRPEIVVFLFITLIVAGLSGRLSPIKHLTPLLVGTAWGGQTTLVVSPEDANELLAEMAPLQLPSHGGEGDGVKSRLLCFCLHKGGDGANCGVSRRVVCSWVADFERAAYPEAVEAFSQSIRRYPREARAYVNRGIAYAHLGRFQDAKADLTQAITLKRQLAAAYYGRGLVAVYLDERDQASADIKQAAQLGDERALRLSRMSIPQAEVTGG